MPVVHHAGAKPYAIAQDVTADESVLTPMAPCRLAYTKGHGGKVSTAPRLFTVGGTIGFETQGGTSGGCGIPIGATAIEATLIASKEVKAGSVKAWAAGSPILGPSVLSFHKNVTIDNSLTVAINPTTAIALAVSASQRTEVGIIVTGYYQAQIEADIESGGAFFGHSSRVVSVSHTVGSGFYAVTLSRPVEGPCSAQATPLDVGHYAAAVTESNDIVNVRVWDLVGGVATAADDEFNLTVTC